MLGSIVVRGARTLVAAVVVGGGLAAGFATAAAPAGAVTPAYYLAMGDSLGANTGASPASNSYVNRLYQHELTRIPGLQLQNISCGGATTSSVLNGPSCAATTQIAQAEAFLQAHPGQVSFVTIDIGGNDVDGCAPGDNACLANGINAVNTNLPTILSRLKTAYPGVRLVGMNYYDPFLANWLSGPTGQTQAQQSVPQADAFNSILANNYTAAGFPTADVATPFDTDDFASTGTYNAQTLPQNVANICNWTHMCESGDIHANNTGHAVLAQAFEDLLDPVAAPGAPGSPTATPGNGTAALSWIAPPNNGPAITAYVVTPYIGAAAQPARTFNSTATSDTVTGLTNETTYTFTVAATNAIGTGPPSGATAAVIVGTPARPTGVVATPGNALAGVRWTAPAANAAAITGYVVTPYVGAAAQAPRTFNSTAVSATIGSLTNGTVYTFSVAAKNALGTGPASAAGAPVTVGAPAPPTNVAAVSGSPTGSLGALNVSFVAGLNHGAAITQYAATCLPSDGTRPSVRVQSGAATTLISVIVTTAKTYSCTVTATNSRGTGVPSVATGPVTEGAPRQPGKPGVSKVAAGSLKVVFLAPGNDGAPITGYTATCASGNGGVTKSASGAASPLTVAALTSGRTYTCSVVATNSRGSSPPSVASIALTV